MQPGFADLACGVEPWKVGAAVEIDDHPAAGVMLGGDDRDRLPGHVDAQAEQLFVDVGEMPLHEFGVEVADVEMDVIEPEPLDLVINRARDDIARRQFGALVEIRHEAIAGFRNQQPSAFAAHRFGDEEVLHLGVEQASRVELHEFHVGDAGASAPRHRNAVAGRAARRGRELIGPPRAAGGQDCRAGGVERDPLGGAIHGIDAPDVARARIALFMTAGGEVDRDHVGNESDVGMRFGRALQRLLHRPAGRVGDMDDATVRMAAFAGEVEGISLGIEWHAELFEPGDRRRRALDDELDGGALVEPGTGDHRILDMALEGIAGFEHGGDSALRPGGRALVERALGEHGHLETLGEIERGGKPGCPGADDQDVGIMRIVWQDSS